MGGQRYSALADWRGGAANWRAHSARQFVFAATSAHQPVRCVTHVSGLDPDFNGATVGFEQTTC
jgi:hypothetical protein